MSESGPQDGRTLLMVAGAVVLVLWVSKGALAVVAGMPLVSQALQVMGLVYVAELLMRSFGKRARTWDGWASLQSLRSLRWPGTTSAPGVVLVTAPPGNAADDDAS